MSTFNCEVVRVGPLEKHPNADTLSITQVFDFPVIVRTGEFNEGDLAVYVPVDAVVPATLEWAFIHDGALDVRHRRVKAKKLRGVFSLGLLTKVPDTGYKSLAVGDDLAAEMGIEKYEPPAPKTYGGPGTHKGVNNLEVPGFPRYTDVDNLRRYPHVLESGEQVVITEKIHGANFRCGWMTVAGQSEPEFIVGSHGVFRRTMFEEDCKPCGGLGSVCVPHLLPAWDSKTGTQLFKLTMSICDRCQGTGKLKDFHNTVAGVNIWHRAAQKYDLAEKLKPYPGLLLFGEVYGDVQDLKYGAGPGEIDLAIFDIYDANKAQFLSWEDYNLHMSILGVPAPPLLHFGEWDPELKRLADGGSLVRPDLDQIREGFVVKPLVERWDRRCGRVILKMVSEAYLLRKGGTEGK